nr:hypothetical protein [Tanacetum cinerariifolium]
MMEQETNLTDFVSPTLMIHLSQEVTTPRSDEVSTARPDISAARLEVSTAEPKTPPTTTLFDDEDVTIADTLERQKQEEATIDALTEEFDEIQAKIDADHELVVRMTHEEQDMYTIKERTRLLTEYFERRKRQLAVEREEAIRNKPPIRTQVRNMMITYLKHMGKYTHQQLKHRT